jgi:hypothetical protein
LHSAYAAQMPKLLCPVHTRWEHRPHTLPKDGLHLAKITFVHSPDNLWCGLPFRRDGTLFWPLQGTGWYWSPEIEAAQRWLGADVIKVHDLSEALVPRMCTECGKVALFEAAQILLGICRRIFIWQPRR